MTSINDIEEGTTIKTPLLSSEDDLNLKHNIIKDDDDDDYYEQPSLADVTVDVTTTTDDDDDESSFRTTTPLPNVTDKQQQQQQPPPPTSRITGTKRLLQLAGPEKYTVVIGCLFLLIRLPFSLAIPHFVAEVLGAVGNGDFDKARENIVFVFVAGTINAVLDFGGIYYYGLAQNRILRNLRIDTFSTILKQEIGFFDENNSGDLISRLTSDCGAMSGDLTWFFRFSIESFVRIIGISTYMLLRSPTLGGATLAIVPLIALINKRYGDWLAKNAKEVQKSLGDATAIAQEGLACIRTVVAFAGEDGEVEKYKEKIEVNYELNMRQLIMTGIYYMVISSFLINTVVQVTLLYVGMNMIRNGTIDSTTLIAFMLYQGQLQSYVLQLLQSFSSLVKSAGAGDLVFALLDRHTKPPGTGHPDVARLIRTDEEEEEEEEDQLSSRDLTLSNVGFSYPSRVDDVVLSDLNLRVPAGSTMALVGPSGCGKSTIINLIERFYDPLSGRVLIGGVDLRDVDIKNHRRHIGIVTQDPILFSCSILSNILYGTPHSTTLTTAIHAAKLANAHNFITSFPSSYDTTIGERGVQLSGGQKQRLSIARAIAKRPKILLLDEATSALDCESERLVQEALDHLLDTDKTMTKVVIAHRLQTVRHADGIAVMMPGVGIVEVGTHEELVRREGGVYRKMVRDASPTGFFQE